MAGSTITPEEYAKIIAPLEARRGETMVPGILICVAICSTASVFVLLLRFLARFFSGIRLATHDWLVTAAWIFLLMQCGTLGAMTRHGLGRHVVVVTEDRDVVALQVLNLCNEVAYFMSLGLMKLSITSLYMSIFPQKKFHWACYAIAAFTVSWMLSGVLATIFMCNPPQRTWDPFNTEGTCINYYALLIATNALNLFTDVVLLILPMPLVLELKLSKHRRMLVIMTFSIGGIACVASAIRMYFLTQLPHTYDGTWDTAYLMEVSAAELLFAFLCACLPTYRPLYRRIFYGNLDSSINSSRPQYNSNMYRNDISMDVRSVKIISDAKTNHVHTKPGIHVTEDIDLTSYPVKRGIRTPDDDEARLTESSEIGITPTSQSFETLPGRQ